MRRGPTFTEVSCDFARGTQGLAKRAVSPWGARGPEFKSRRSDQYLRAVPKVRWSHQWSHLRETAPAGEYSLALTPGTGGWGTYEACSRPLISWLQACSSKTRPAEQAVCVRPVL